MTFFKNLGVEIPYDPATFLGIYPRGEKTNCRDAICTFMFITAMFTIANIWKQPNYLKTDN